MSDRSNIICSDDLLAFPVARPGVTAGVAEAPLRPVLIVLHQETSTPGRVGHAIAELSPCCDLRDDLQIGLADDDQFPALDIAHSLRAEHLRIEL